MTFRFYNITSGPSREEILNGFGNWWSNPRPSVKFTAEDGAHSWYMPIVGVNALDCEGRWLLISCGGSSGWKKEPTDPVDWRDSVIIEIKYDTRKRVGTMKKPISE